MVIHKGEQFYILCEATLDGQRVEPDDLDGFRVQIGDRLCEWPDGELEYSQEEQAWLYPLTEEQTYGLCAGKRKIQMSVLIGNEILKTDMETIEVKDSIIKKRWLAP